MICSTRPILEHSTASATGPSSQGLDVESLQLREARWVIPDLEGRGNRVRTVTVPAGVKARIDLWTNAAGITEGRIFRPVTRAGVVKGSAILDEKVVWRLVVRYARETELGKLAYLTCAGPAPSCAAKPVATWSRSSFYCAMPVQTTERYLERSRPWCRRSMMDWGWTWDRGVYL